ncbi:kinase/pyrophosphorylase [Echinicola strongylocentroti]|uniref:Kinase/pyrophosphorylase n=1 Tax=Echinicola strongylocentroti TaxID=1795355 RepID=A0A2Z4IR12_9BACT|nr:pyruvate, water dikinase regulatory protein [Echinicola strongylocentroti]AWW32743.1 kinase/pyrophosphorylase [Echinicola strongylocentroti]
MSRYTIYLASDSLSFLEPESVTRLAASHFADHSYDIVKFANVRTSEKAQEIVTLAKQTPPSLLVFSTVLIDVRDTFIMKCLEQQVECIDLLSPFVKSLGKVLKTAPVHQLNYSWKLNDEYFRRIHAIEFAINNDDGKSLSALQKADIILIGVSRTSKTPLSIYLSYHSYLVVNIPLVGEESIPKHLYDIPRRKIIGLTIHPNRLNHIRSERNMVMGVGAESSYSDLGHIIDELEFAEGIMKRIGCPIIDVSNNAVEETAEEIMKIIKKPIN